MTTSKTDELLRVLQQHFNPREEGWIWLALYADDRDGGLLNQIEGHYADAAEVARGLAAVINETGIAHAFVALCRREGCPTEADRELWGHLRTQASAEALVDLVVFNRIQATSMRAEDAAAA